MEVRLGDRKYHDLCLEIGEMKIYVHKYFICPQLSLIEMLLNRASREPWPPVHTLTLYPPDNITEKDLKEALEYIYKPGDLNLSRIWALIYLGAQEEPLINNFKRFLNIKTLSPEEKEIITYFWEHYQHQHELLWPLVAFYGLDRYDPQIFSPKSTPTFFTSDVPETYGVSPPLLDQEGLKTYFTKVKIVKSDSWHYFVIDQDGDIYDFETLGIKWRFVTRPNIWGEYTEVIINFTGVDETKRPHLEKPLKVRGLIFGFSHATFRYKEIPFYIEEDQEAKGKYRNRYSDFHHNNPIYLRNFDEAYRIVLYLQEYQSAQTK